MRLERSIILLPFVPFLRMIARSSAVDNVSGPISNNLSSGIFSKGISFILIFNLLYLFIFQYPPLLATILCRIPFSFNFLIFLSIALKSLFNNKFRLFAVIFLDLIILNIISFCKFDKFIPAIILAFLDLFSSSFFL
jgi:hypothetical protein